MKFDVKSYGTIYKVKDHSIIPEDRWMLFQIKDNAFPATLNFYLEECKRLGADAEQIATVERAIERLKKWRDEHPAICKVPDAAGEKLLDRP